MEGEEGDLLGNEYLVFEDTLPQEDEAESAGSAAPPSSEAPTTIEIGPGYNFTLQVPGGVKGFFGYPRTIGEPDPWSGGWTPGPRPAPPTLPFNVEEMASSPPGVPSAIVAATGQIKLQRYRIVHGPC